MYYNETTIVCKDTLKSLAYYSMICYNKYVYFLQILHGSMEKIIKYWSGYL